MILSYLDNYAKIWEISIKPKAFPLLVEDQIVAANIKWRLEDQAEDEERTNYLYRCCPTQTSIFRDYYFYYLPPFMFVIGFCENLTNKKY